MNKDILGFAVADNKEIFKEKKGKMNKMLVDSAWNSLLAAQAVVGWGTRLARRRT